MTEWVLLIFMAADNDLDHFAVKDLHEMERIGSSDAVKLVVQIDRYGNGKQGAALRGTITKNLAWQPYDFVFTSVLEDIGETNTGDPLTLRDFIVWGVTTHPAKRYGLVIWNHGSGWKPDFIYKKAEDEAGARVAGAMRAVGFGDQYQRRLSRILFRKNAERLIEGFIHQTLGPLLAGNNFPKNSKAWLSILSAPPAGLPDLKDDELEKIIVRAIGLDESSNGDALDSIELKAALTQANTLVEVKLGAPFKLAVLGFDACLMAGIEVAFQVAQCASYVVGSEEIEPSIGWDYSLMLEALNAVNGEMADDKVAVGAVDWYVEGMKDYRIRLVTQSSVMSLAAEPFLLALDQLGELLIELIHSDYAAIAKSEKQATRFYDTDFLDIGDFLRLLQSAHNDPRITNCMEKLTELVIASKFSFANVNQHPTGLSVYFPTRPAFNDAYLTLDMAAKTPRWIQAIKSYHFL